MTNAIYAPINVNLKGRGGGRKGWEFELEAFFWSNALPKGHHIWLKHPSN